MENLKYKNQYKGKTLASVLWPGLLLVEDFHCPQLSSEKPLPLVIDKL